MADFLALKAKRQAKRTSSTSSTAVEAAPSQLEQPSTKTQNEPQPPQPAQPIFSHALPALVELRTFPSRGRGIAAKTTFNQGQTVLSTRPLVAALDQANLGVRCSNCLKAATDTAPPAPLLQCSICKTVQYCSAACQGADWTEHKLECKAIIAYGKARPSKNGKRQVPDSALRALGRIVWASERDAATWAAINSMQSHLAELTSEEKEKLFQLSVSLASYVGQDLLARVAGSSTDLLALCSRFQANSFALTAPDLSNVGVCTSPLFALFNHSCAPNAVVVFPNFPTATKREAMRVVAIRRIEPGEEILTSYVDLTLPAALRNRELVERYRFSCDCEECGRVKGRKGAVDPREAVACARKGCGGSAWLPELKLVTGEVDVECGRCGKETTINAEEVEAAIAGGVEFLKRVEAEAASPDILTTLDSTISQLSSLFLSPTSYPLLGLTQALLSARIALALFDARTSALASSVHASLKGVLPSNHPSRGIAAAVVVRLRGAGEESNAPGGVWATREGLQVTGALAREALEELRGMGEGSRVSEQVRDVLRAVDEGLGRIAA